MLESVMCFVAALIVFVAARRSLVAGLIATFAVGYLYGITRANFVGAASHFIFDSGIVGFYAARWTDLKKGSQKRDWHWLNSWVVFLTIWPVLLFLMPVQDPLIQVVGLRADIFFLPFLLFGAQLDEDQVFRLARAL